MHRPTGVGRFLCTAAIMPMLLLLASWSSAAQDGIAVVGLVRTYRDDPSGTEVWLRQGATVYKTVCDEKGAFAFRGLSRGTTEIVAYKEGFAVGGFTAYMVGDTNTSVQLAKAGEAAIRVLNIDAQPIAGARVKSFSVDGRYYVPVDALVPHGFPVLRADDDGYIRFKLLPDGRYAQLTVGHEAFTDADRVYLPVDGTEKNVPLREGLPLYVRVKNAAGEPVQGAQLLLVRPSAEGRRKFADEQTDQDGLATLRAPRGEYVLAIQHTKYGSPDPESVVLTSTERAIEKTITLPRARYIEGRIKMPDERPPAGVRILCRDGNTVHDDVLTGEDGTFRLKLGKATGVVTVVPPPGYMMPVAPDIPVDLKELDKVTLNAIRLETLPVVSGVVRDVEGAVLENALLSSMNLDPPAWAITDAEGRFRMPLAYLPEKGKLSLRAEHPLRFQRRDFEVRVRDPKPESVRLRDFRPDQAQRPPEQSPNHISPLLDKPAPTIECSHWWNTEPLTMEALRGKVVVLTFWAGFVDSPAGINRIEELRALHTLLGAVDDVEFVIVHDSISEPYEIEAYIARYRIGFPVGRDADPLVTFDHYGINFTPQTVLIDKKGVLRYYQVDGRLLELIKVLRREAG